MEQQTPEPQPPELPPPPPPATIAPPPLPPPPPILFVPPRLAPMDEPRPALDWLAPTAGTTLGLGVVFVVSGAIVLGTSGGEQYCGIGGCVDRPDPRSENLGASLLGAGVGFATVGGLGLLGTIDAPRGFERRKSQPLMLTGFALTSLAAASLGVGIGQATTYSEDTDLSTAWPFFMASSIAAGVGIPMLAIGSKVRTQEQRDADRRRDELLRDPSVPKQPYSKVMIGVGSGLTGIGGTAILAATGIFLVDVGAGGPGDFSTFAALPALGAGTFFTAVGIPLIVAGAQKEVAPGGPAPGIVPELRTSGTALTASWSVE